MVERNAIKIDKNEVQKFQLSLARVDTNKRDKHDDKQDQALIIAYRNGDEDAGWELMKSYKEVLATIYRYPTKAPRNTDAQKKLQYDTMTPYEKEDLFQEIAFQFFKLVLEYEPEKPFEHAVRAILHQRVFNQFFSKEIAVRLNEVELEEEEEGSANDSDIQLKDTPDKHMDLYQALNQLTGKQREVIELTIVKGWTAKVTAEELGTTTRAVEETKRRGLNKLKLIMGG